MLKMKSPVEITKHFFSRNFVTVAPEWKAFPSGKFRGSRSIHAINIVLAGKPLHGTYKIKNNIHF